MSRGNTRTVSGLFRHVLAAQNAAVSFKRTTLLPSFSTNCKTHVFDEAVKLVSTGSLGQWQCQVHPAYANMIGPYGGITLAQALHAIMIDPRRHGDPTSITMNYVAPVDSSTPEIIATLKRTNRSTQHWTADFIQNGEIVACAMILCAVRKGTFDHIHVSMPQVPSPESLSRSQARFPEWVSRYDMRYVTGEPSLSLTNAEVGEPALNASSKTVVWIKDTPNRPIDFQSLSAITDAFYPRIYILRPRFIPAGTVSITVYFHVCADDLKSIGSDYLLGDASGTVFHRSFADQTVMLWTRSGRLLATSTQCVYFKG